MRKSAQVVSIARARHPLRAMENQIDAAIVDNAHVTVAMIEARKAANLPAGAGHALIKRNLQIGLALGEIRENAVELHADCRDFLETVDLPTGFGDQWDC
jgi:hypothetical protein